jgi:hypothetical protein
MAKRHVVCVIGQDRDWSRMECAAFETEEEAIANEVQQYKDIRTAADVIEQLGLRRLSHRHGLRRDWLHRRRNFCLNTRVLNPGDKGGPCDEHGPLLYLKARS